MIRFNRLILIFRILLVVVLTNSLIFNLIVLISLDTIDLQENFLQYLLFPFFIFAIIRILKLIFKESLDVRIESDKIVVINILTRKQVAYSYDYILGYRIESYRWNVLKLPMIRSFWDFESRMIVIYSSHRALIHLKALNYWKYKRIIDLLLSNDYNVIPRYKRLFDKFNYRYI